MAFALVPRVTAAPTGLLESFLAAIQASVSVLLVIFYGGVAAHLKLLNAANSKALSKICVRMFLPALLITKIGSELHASSADRYGIIVLWAIICHLISFVIGIVAHLGLGMPDWTTVAIMFNNTTSYPLLLIAALNETGILKSLIVTDETTAAAIERAKSYFLVFATISSCLTFAVGPRLIDTEHAPETGKDKDQDANHGSPSSSEGEASEETGLLTEVPAVQFTDPFRNRANSFFPSTRKTSTAQVSYESYESFPRRPSLIRRHHWVKLGPRTRWWLLFISDFFNAPLLGAILGAIIGLTPVLHRAFFNDTEDGGIFTAWLTASFKTIGSLFVPLPVVVAGVSLYNSAREQRDGEQARARLPWVTVTFILVIRFVIWPVASIGLIYVLASKTTILGPDPMLWFAMMLMPTGPPAMKLITLVQVSDAEPEDESNIARLLTISYLISPLLSFTVVGSLKASQSCIS